MNGNIEVTVNDDGTLSVKADNVKVKENMTVEKGIKLEISGSLDIEEGKTITIEEGASLTLDNSINAYELLKDKEGSVIENNGDLTLYAWGNTPEENGNVLTWYLGDGIDTVITGTGDTNLYLGKSE